MDFFPFPLDLVDTFPATTSASEFASLSPSLSSSSFSIIIRRSSALLPDLLLLLPALLVLLL